MHVSLRKSSVRLPALLVFLAVATLAFTLLGVAGPGPKARATGDDPIAQAYAGIFLGRLDDDGPLKSAFQDRHTFDHHEIWGRQAGSLEQILA